MQTSGRFCARLCPLLPPAFAPSPQPPARDPQAAPARPPVCRGAGPLRGEPSCCQNRGREPGALAKTLARGNLGCD